MAGRKVNGPTKAELEILSVLWARGPSTVREVHEELGGDGRTGYTTTLKFMQIMHEKGIVTRDESSRSHVYSSSVSRDKTRQRMVLDMVERAFGGSARKLILHALGTGDISAEEAAEIRRLLHQPGEDRDGTV